MRSGNSERAGKGCLIVFFLVACDGCDEFEKINYLTPIENLTIIDIK